MVLSRRRGCGQVALGLRFVDEIMADDYRPYLQHLWAQQYPLQTHELERAYPKIEISAADLVKAKMDEAEAEMLTEKHRQQISQTMRNHYILDLFWPELQQLPQSMIMNLNQD